MFLTKEWKQLSILLIFSIFIIIWIIKSNSIDNSFLQSDEKYYPIYYHTSNKQKSKLMESLYTEITMYQIVFDILKKMIIKIVYLPKNILLQYI